MSKLIIAVEITEPVDEHLRLLLTRILAREDHLELAAEDNRSLCCRIVGRLEQTGQPSAELYEITDLE